MLNAADPMQIVTEQALSWPEQAQQLQILDAGTYTRAGEMLRSIKALRKEVDEAFDPIIRKAHDAHREACGQKKRAETPLAEAETILKRALVAYDTEQDRLRREEEARLREIARREEEERRVQEAAALETEAVETNNPELLYEANELIERPIEAPIVQLPKATPKVEGLSFREKWEAVVTDKLALIRYVAAHPEFLALLDVNATNLRKFAEMQKDKLALPGVRPRMEKIAASRGR